MTLLLLWGLLEGASFADRRLPMSGTQEAYLAAELARLALNISWVAFGIYVLEIIGRVLWQS